MAVEVPLAWGQPGAELEIDVPARVTCARCDGGGCDACDRTGALRLFEGETAPTLRLRFSSAIGDGVVVRVDDPIGDRDRLDQMLVTIRPARAPSPNCRRVFGPLHERRGWSAAWLVAALAIAAILAAIAATR
jgi:hypothetical protein